jgi:hypothetical protein
MRSAEAHSNPRLRSRLEVVEGDLRKFTVERGAIHRKTDAVEPFVHPGGILARWRMISSGTW